MGDVGLALFLGDDSADPHAVDLMTALAEWRRRVGEVRVAYSFGRTTPAEERLAAAYDAFMAEESHRG